MFLRLHLLPVPISGRTNQTLIAKIMGYGYYQLGNVTISWIHYVEGLGHNFFYVGQFCDSDLEVACQSHTCYVWNLDGADLLSGSRDINLYTISLDDMLKSSLICLLSKALNTKSWLWHRWLSHLNFGTLNQLAKQGLVQGLPNMKFEIDHLCSACSLGKRKKYSHKPKAEDNNQEKLYLLHMDLCGPMRVESINGVDESPKTPHFHDDPLHETLHEDLTSQGSSSNVRSSHTPLELLGKWTKNYPLANVIGDPSQLVSIRNKLKANAMWCYFDAFLTFVEPKILKKQCSNPPGLKQCNTPKIGRSGIRISGNSHAFCNNDDDDDDEEYTIAVTPVLQTVEPYNSLSMGDKHLSTIPETESDEVIKSSVEDLIPIPSEFEGISDDTCGVPFCDNSPPLDVLNDHFEIFSDFNDDCTLSDDDSFEDIDYVEASPPDSELVSLEEVNDDILHEKLLNIYLLIAKIESLNDNPTPYCVLKSPSTFPIPVEDSDSFFKKSDTSLSYSDNSLPEFETFSDHTEKTSSGSTTTHTDYSLPEYDSFLFETEPDQGELSSIVIEDILGEPCVYVPNVLPTHTILMLNSDFIPSDDSLGSDLEVSFPSGTRNKIFDPGIFIRVQSKRFLSPNEFSISFICDPLSLVFDTLLPFSSENEDNPIALDFEASRTHGFVLRSLELQSLA
ncbi:ribonuclease H-like domain-containing protein [Tanacetum coccineum]